MASSPSTTPFSPVLRRSFGVALWMLTLLMLGVVAGCGEDKREAAETVGSLESPPFARMSADLDGVLLAGSPSDPALGAIGWMAPSPAKATQVSSDGILLNRVLAVVAPSASIEDVNVALAGQSATILSMSGGNPALVVLIPESVDEGAVRVVSDALVATQAFIHVQPIRGIALRPASSAVGPSAALAPASGDGAWHWDALELWAAWNLRESQATGEALQVYNVDFFDSLNLTSGTSKMRFLSSVGNLTPGAGNGLHAKSLIAGAFDSDVPGIAPDQTVAVTSIPMGFLSAIELMYEIAWQIGDNDLDHFILRTAFNYIETDEEFDVSPRGDRALDALVWRITSETTPGLRNPEILHLVPAGDDYFANPDAAFQQSPFAISANFPDLLAFAAQGGAAEAAKIRPMWTAYASANPVITAASSDIYTVGAQDLFGQTVPNTATNADLVMPGQRIPGACLMNCESAGIVSLTGSAVASSLAAGAAAFIWSLDPELNPGEVAVILSISSDGEIFANLYRALLSVDVAIDVVNAPARLRMLDVAGPTIGSLTPNGIFDELDLETYLEFFEQFETQREIGGVDVDHSRFDLNGNGYTGGDEVELGFSAFAQFDLDADNESATDVAIQMILGSEVEFEEAFVTDAEILCFYGYSGLYAGDEARRDELLAPACRRLEIEFDFPDEIELGVPTELSLVVGEDQGGGVFLGEEDALVDIFVVGGSASPSSGMTDANGLFFTDITAALAGPLDIEIRATADDGREVRLPFTVNSGSSLLSLGVGTPVTPPLGGGTGLIPVFGTLRDELGLPVSNEVVGIVLRAQGIGWAGVISLTTDDDGAFEYEFPISTVGEHQFEAYAPGATVPVVATTYVTPRAPLAEMSWTATMPANNGFECDYTDLQGPSNPFGVIVETTATVVCEQVDREGRVTMTAHLDQKQIAMSGNEVQSISMTGRVELEWADVAGSNEVFLSSHLRVLFIQIEPGSVEGDFELDAEIPDYYRPRWALNNNNGSSMGGVPPSGPVSLESSGQSYVNVGFSDGGRFPTGHSLIIKAGSGSSSRILNLTLSVVP